MLSWLRKKSSTPPTAPQAAAGAVAAGGQAAQAGLADESTAHKKRGDQYFGEGKLEDAAKSYRQAIAINPDFAEVYNNLGNVLREQGLPGDAERCLKQAIRIKPGLANAYCNLGALLLEQGKLGEAIENLKKALELKPDVEIIYRDLCYALFQSGQYEAAKQIIAKGMTLNPDFADFHSFLGNLYCHEKEFDKAVACYQRALSIQPDYAEAHSNLGKVFQEQGKLSEAVACFRKALALKPDLAYVHHNLGMAFQKQGLLDKAMDYCRKTLALKPDFAEACVTMGNILKEQGNPDEAMACYYNALALKPDCVEAHNNLGGMFEGQEKPDEAIACYQKALAIKPDAADVYCNLGLLSKRYGKFSEAIAYYQKAVELNPDFADAYCNLGNVFFEQDKLGDALVCFRKALALKPDFANACLSLGAVLVAQKKNQEAVACFRRTLELEPDHFTARTLLLHQLQHMCDWKDFDANVKAVRRALSEAPATGKHLFVPLAFLAIPGATAEEQKRSAERWVQSKFKDIVSLREKLGFELKRAPDKKISVAYISADFRQHPVSFLMAEVFELHDRNRFHVTAYSYDTDESSAMRKRLEMAFDDFVDIRFDSYEEAARKIYADHIDILVDLTGHTENSRSAILALRPAPIQVNYLGYPGTMGAEFVDYMIADRFTIPPEMRQHYTEKIVWMPDCFQANDRTRPRPASPNRKGCGLPENDVVFCCFNQTLKITPEMFDIWCRLLTAVPGSILWLPASNPQAEGNLRREAENRGVAAGRLVMAPLLHREEHLARLQCADLFLDTLPFNAGTTCSDALWMGLPVITCAGDAFASRMAGSLLTAIGVPELITYNLEDYYRLALDLATNRKKLEAFRSKIIANRDTAPLFDSERFTRNLEKAYTQMVEEHTKSINVR